MISLSICIPTYNRAHYLKETLQAFLNQIKDKDNIEIVISDNASCDGTYNLVKEFREKFKIIKYYRNERNLGLDLNVLRCVEKAKGEYCWLFSDDDLPLPGVVDYVLKAINRYSPPLLYLNFAGFIENEPYTVVLQYGKDKKDIIYYDSETMIKKHLLNHLSATVVKRELFLKYSWVIDKFKKMGLERGYCLIINHYVILNHPPPYVYLGKLSVAVRNPLRIDGNRYNPLTIIIDNARHFQTLRKEGLISEETEEFILNDRLKGFYRIILAMKCYNIAGYTKEKIDLIKQLCRKYRNFWYYLYPAIILPRWFLIFPYWFGRNIKRIIRRILKRSPFQ